MLQWYVAVVPAQKEFAARDRLKDLGYQVMVPVEYKWRRKSRHTRKRIEVAVPLLPRYVFVGTDCPLYWWQVRRCPLIQGFLGWDGMPTPLPPAGVRALERLQFGIPEPISNPHKSIKAGDQVKFVTGAMRGKI